MASAEQSGEALRDYGSPATWGDVEQVRHSLEAKIETQIADVKTQIAEMDGRIQSQMAEMETRLVTRTEVRMSEMETRLMRWSAGLAAAAGLAMIGFLVGIIQAVD